MTYRLTAPALFSTVTIMSRPHFVRVCQGLALAGAFCVPTAFAQSSAPASRVGPQPLGDPLGPRVVEVQGEEPAAPVTASSAAAPTRPAASVLQQVAAARATVAARQLDRLAPYNQHALPGAAVYLQSQVLPPATTIRPSRTGAPVQLFQPGSTFSHVIERAATNRRIAELEVAAETARTAETRAKEAADAATTPRNRSEIEADLAANAARMDSARLRLAQLQALSRITYSQLYQNLGDKLQLEVYEAQVMQRALLQERQRQQAD